jgi:allantoicase
MTMSSADFTRLCDLAAERLGGRALLASDEFFAPKENLLKGGRGIFVADRYTEQGKWMDGWETRRRRQSGHDWCIVALAAPGVIRGVVIDTNHFRGNHPAAASIDGCLIEGTLETSALPGLPWREILAQSPIQGHSENRFAVSDEGIWSHVRLNIYPDGGVARLRVHGQARPHWSTLAGSGEPVDLAAALSGASILACSDEFFGEPRNLLMPGRAATMGEGWETRRRRGPGHDWCIIALGARGTIETVEVDTNHFKGNYPDRFSLEAADVDLGSSVDPGRALWTMLLRETRLEPHAVRRWSLAASPPCTVVRFNIYPDGGVSRLRLYGRPIQGLERLNRLDAARAHAEFLRCCGSARWAADMTARRPFATKEALLRAADDAWAGLERGDRLEAFACHPRLGGDVMREGSAGTAGWSRQEQSGVDGASAEVRRRLAEANEAYSRRFGHVFLMCATGKSAGEVLAQLERRLSNDATTEFQIATEEQRLITRLRLERLIPS